VAWLQTWLRSIQRARLAEVFFGLTMWFGLLVFVSGALMPAAPPSVLLIILAIVAWLTLGAFNAMCFEELGQPVLKELSKAEDFASFIRKYVVTVISVIALLIVATLIFLHVFRGVTIDEVARNHTPFHAIAFVSALMLFHFGMSWTALFWMEL
jgi:hypothetical protein